MRRTYQLSDAIRGGGYRPAKFSESRRCLGHRRVHAPSPRLKALPLGLLPCQLLRIRDTRLFPPRIQMMRAERLGAAGDVSGNKVPAVSAVRLRTHPNIDLQLRFAGRTEIGVIKTPLHCRIENRGVDRAVAPAEGFHASHQHPDLIRGEIAALLELQTFRQDNGAHLGGVVRVADKAGWLLPRRAHLVDLVA